MRTRNKEKGTRDAVIARIREIEKELAEFVERNIGQNEVSLNTGSLYKKVGGLEELRTVLWE